MELKIQLKNITKYMGYIKVLDNIDLEFCSGKIYGLIGKNGAGKTMLLRILSGLMIQSEGEIYINDRICKKTLSEALEIGLVLENIGVYPEFTGFRNLKILSKFKKKIGDEEIKEAIRKVGLDPEDKRPVRKYSLGMKKRIVLAQAIMEKPQLLLLDEPTNAVDQNGILEFYQIIEELKHQGTTIVIASHSKEDITKLCDYVIMLKDGKVVNEDEEIC